jgi:hypothetical protein
MGTEDLDYSCRGVKLTAHLHPVPRLGMSGAMSTFLLYVFIAWTGKTLKQQTNFVYNSADFQSSPV